MALWRDDEVSDHWWCDLQTEFAVASGDLAGLFFDVAYRQRDPRTASGRFSGFPNATEFAWALAQSYTTTDWPCQREDRSFWIAAFRSVGFLDDGRRSPTARPSEPLTLFRAGGAYDLEHPPGLSWTTSRATAEFFARYNDQHDHRSYVFEALVPPDRLLARFSAAAAPQGAGDPPAGDQWIADVEPGRLR